MQTLMQKYKQYTDRLKAQGVAFLEFACPSCGGAIETQQPPVDDVWDTLSTCPHCEAMFMKITAHDAVRALLPPTPEARP